MIFTAAVHCGPRRTVWLRIFTAQRSIPMTSRTPRRRLIAALTLLPVWAAAQSGDFPKMTVRVVVPYPAGGSLDAIARPMGPPFEQQTGQSLLIENVPGAGGLIAASRVVQSKPDGYTLLLASNAQVSTARLQFPSMNYDPQTDLVPIIHLVDQVAVLYTSAKSPYRSAADVVAAAKREPGKVNVASTGGISHFAIELLAQAAGVRLNHVPYKGAAAALQDLAGDQVPLLFTYVGSAKALTAAGMVRPIAVASGTRMASLPDVPTFAEAGLPAVVASVWVGLMGPKDLPAATVQRLAEVSNAILKQPDYKQKMEGLSMAIHGGTPADLRAVIQTDTRKWEQLAKTANLKIE